MRRKILFNKAQCNKCGNIIESTHVYDFKYCECKNFFVDGGRDYARRGWESDGPGYTELTEYADESSDEKDSPLD